jgi:hypothetical protein
MSGRRLFSERNLLLFARALLARQPAAIDKQEAVKLSVWYGPMPESNGKSNWTAILHNGDIASGITLDRSEYPDRVRYEADRARWLIGELPEEPFILNYDADKHSGYVKPAAPSVEQDERGAFEEWARERFPAKHLSTGPDSRAMDEAREFAWEGWEARAASTSANVASKPAALDQGYVTVLIKRMQDYCDSLAPPMARGLMAEAVRALRAASTSSGRCFFCGEPMDGEHEQDCPQADKSANVAQGAEAVTANGKPASQYFRAGRNQGLQEALYACKREHLEEPTATADDIAYTNAIDDCLKAIGRLLAAQFASGDTQ